MGAAKAKGTRRETAHVRKAAERGLPARRAENNLPGRDVDVTADVLRVVEVKDRQNLNVHQVLADTQRRHPGYPAYVVWHRTAKRAGAARSTPCGPTLACLPEDDLLDLLAIARHAKATCSFRVFADDAESLTSALEALDEAVARVADSHPEAS